MVHFFIEDNRRVQIGTSWNGNVKRKEYKIDQNGELLSDVKLRREEWGVSIMGHVQWCDRVSDKGGLGGAIGGGGRAIRVDIYSYGIQQNSSVEQQNLSIALLARTRPAHQTLPCLPTHSLSSHSRCHSSLLSYSFHSSVIPLLCSNTLASNQCLGRCTYQ